MDIKKELLSTLVEIDYQINFANGIEMAQLLTARVKVLQTLQKYEVGGIVD